MESDTVNKLSYLPLCITKRTTPEWAKRACYQKPGIPMQKDTTYMLRYELLQIFDTFSLSLVLVFIVQIFLLLIFVILALSRTLGIQDLSWFFQ